MTIHGGPSMAATLALLLTAGSAGAQNLVVGNARIVDGTGTVIERGSVVVEDGRITSVSADSVRAEGRTYVDAQGMTVLPGLIDTHVHISGGRFRDSEEAWAWLLARMHDYLEGGFTTLLDAMGDVETLGRARGLVEQGELAGPRLLFVGMLVGPANHPCEAMPCANTDNVVEVTDAAVAREHVRRFAEAGVDMIKVTYEETPTEQSKMSNQVLAAICEEAESLGLPVIVHAVRAPNALAAIRLGADKFAHAPLAPVREPVDVAALSRTFIDRNIPFATTTHLLAPLVDDSGENTGHGWGLNPGVSPTGFLTYLTRARQAYDAGVLVAFGTDGFSTEHRWHEVETLARAFAPAEIIRMMTRNAAAFLDLEDEIGTLEPGKLGDLVVIDGNPLADIRDLAKVSVVVRGGRIVVDHREAS